MARKSWHKALLALALAGSVLGVTTLGTAHAYLHGGEHAAASSDCAKCHAVKTGSTAYGGPATSPLHISEVSEIATVHQAGKPVARVRASIASRAPPA